MRTSPLRKEKQKGEEGIDELDEALERVEREAKKGKGLTLWGMDANTEMEWRQIADYNDCAFTALRYMCEEMGRDDISHDTPRRAVLRLLQVRKPQVIDQMMQIDARA